MRPGTVIAGLGSGQHRAGRGTGPSAGAPARPGPAEERAGPRIPAATSTCGADRPVLRRAGLAADRAPRAACGTASLAGALLKGTEGPAWAAASPAAAMSTRALLDARISQLETGAEPPLAAAGRATAGRTAAVAVLLAAAVAWPAVIVAHDRPVCVPW